MIQNVLLRPGKSYHVFVRIKVLNQLPWVEQAVDLMVSTEELNGSIEFINNWRSFRIVVSCYQRSCFQNEILL